MASTAEILESILSKPPSGPHGVAYNYLIPNVRGIESLVSILQRSHLSGASAYPTQMSSSTPVSSQHNNTTEISLFAAATEAFSQTNTNCTIAESLERSRPIIDLPT